MPRLPRSGSWPMPRATRHASRPGRAETAGGGRGPMIALTRGVPGRPQGRPPTRAFRHGERHDGDIRPPLAVAREPGPGDVDADPDRVLAPGLAHQIGEAMRGADLDAAGRLADSDAGSGLGPGGDGVVHAAERRHGWSPEVTVIPGMHGCLVGGFPGQLSQALEDLLSVLVALAAEIAGIEEGDVDIANRGRIEAIAGLAPDDVPDDPGADPGVRQ